MDKNIEHGNVLVGKTNIKPEYRNQTMSNLKETMAAFQTEFESGAASYKVKPTQIAVMHQFDDELGNTGILEKSLAPAINSRALR